MSIRNLLIAAVAVIPASGQIIADFRTSEGDFNVLLDYVNAPLAVANFIHLAGKEDDILETRAGVPDLYTQTAAHSRQGYYSLGDSDAPKLPLQVYLVPATETMRQFYGIFQSQTYIGGVEFVQSNGYHPDITGQDRIRLEQVSATPNVFRITLRYPRPWLDARDQKIKEAPMYRNLRINRVETGKRFFAGSMTTDRDEHPGYHFQDEVLRVPGNTVNPYGTTFNTAWILAMDNTGPNKNGSRFFITSAADPSWNGQYTALGTVIQNAGRLVVSSIANTGTDENQEPNSEMFIYDITFRRGGVAQFPDGTPGDAAFFEGYHQTFLPGAIEGLCLDITRTESGYSLVTELRPRSQTILYQGADLRNLSGGAIDVQSPSLTEPMETDLTTAIEFFPKYFLKGFTTSLPNWPSAEFDLAGAQLSFKVNSGVDEGSLSLIYDNVSGTSGSYTIDTVIEQTEEGEDPVFVVSRGSGTFTSSYDSSKGPYKGILTLNNLGGPLNVEEITLHLDSTRFANNPNINQSTIIRRFDARTTDPEVTFLGYSGIYQKVK